MVNILNVIPRVQYNNQELTDILRRVVDVKQRIRNHEVYYPYVIKDGERADTIAYDYYGSSEYTWLIYLVNDIYDPYYQWPLSGSQFIDYLKEKYGNYTDTLTDISHYEYTGVPGDNQFDIDSKNYVMSTTTFDNLSTADRAGWSPVTVYDHELQLNENKRYIRLLSNFYLNQIDKEVRELFEGVD